MQQALTTPLLKSVVLGTLMVTAGAIYAASTDHSVTHRLVLNTTEEPGAIYLSEWKVRDVTATFDDGELRPITYTITADMFDGCRWRAVETLVPIDDKTFSYDYSETILSCVEGAVPMIKTPRIGTVTLED
ncbi:MAG: hypothetical protein H0T42_27570 [Deltaproteobacteria bacterium]|nr:hypothetical protein [Deltaproteobacteria bacterium]